MAKFRILSLDGGGVMGAFSASVLATYEAMLNADRAKRNLPPMPLVDHFDLVTGTSTGGIMAIGLAMGASASQLRDFYRDAGPKIFPRTGGVAGWLKRPFDFVREIFRPKFSSVELRAAIEAVVGQRPMKEARNRLVVPSYDTGMGRVYLFKTPHHRWCEQDADTKALDVALATSAAPTYFQAHSIEGRGTFIDGGVWANCPATVGIIEALSFCGQKIEDLHVLSISTTNYPFRLGKEVQLGGLRRWAPMLVDTFMFSQAQASVGLSTCLLRDRSQDKPIDRFFRIDYLALPHIYSLADTRLVQELIEVGRGEAEKIANRTVVMGEFLDGNPAPKWTRDSST